jgi:hypothetical protein
VRAYTDARQALADARLDGVTWLHAELAAATTGNATALRAAGAAAASIRGAATEAGAAMATVLARRAVQTEALAVVRTALRQASGRDGPGEWALAGGGLRTELDALKAEVRALKGELLSRRHLASPAPAWDDDDDDGSPDPDTASAAT